MQITRGYRTLAALAAAGLLGAVTTVAGGGTAAAAPSTDRVAAECRGTSWVFGFRTTQGGRPLVTVRADQHSDSVVGDATCDERLNLLCARTTTNPPPPEEGVVRPRYALPWSGTRVYPLGRVAGSELTSRAAADARCASGLGPAWRMATTLDGGTGDGYLAEGTGHRVWMSIDDQRSNPWDTTTGKALSFTVWKDFERDLTYATRDQRTNPYTGDTPVTTALPLLCIRQDGRVEPALPFLEYGGWAAGRVAMTQRVLGTALTTQAKADAICRNQFGTGWRMSEFHDGGGWNFWADGNIGRFWVADADGTGNPWD